MSSALFYIMRQQDLEIDRRPHRPATVLKSFDSAAWSANHLDTTNFTNFLLSFLFVPDHKFRFLSWLANVLLWAAA
jgi:hypothetical protein